MTFLREREMTSLYGVFGASGFGREVMPVLRGQILPVDSTARLVFVDDNPPAATLNAHQCMAFAEFASQHEITKYISLAIANSAIRKKLASRCIAEGISFIDVHAANVVTMDEVVIDEGSILSPFVTITSNVRVGRHFHANIYSYIAHDCVIGDYVTFAPRVMCNGNVHIEDHAYIGTGSIIKQGVPGKPLVIGKGAVVGMGAVVTKDVPAGVTVVGNPARAMVR